MPLASRQSSPLWERHCRPDRRSCLIQDGFRQHPLRTVFLYTVRRPGTSETLDPWLFYRIYAIPTEERSQADDDFLDAMKEEGRGVSRGWANKTQRAWGKNLYLTIITDVVIIEPWSRHSDAGKLRKYSGESFPQPCRRRFRRRRPGNWKSLTQPGIWKI